jgi:hypothetical protein
VDAGVSNIYIHNNLLQAINAYGTTSILGNGCPACYTASNNSTDAQAKGAAGFTTYPPVNPADFKPAAGSYAIGAGTAVPVWTDFFSTLRPQNGVIDIGAIEGP